MITWPSSQHFKFNIFINCQCPSLLSISTNSLDNHCVVLKLSLCPHRGPFFHFVHVHINTFSRVTWSKLIQFNSVASWRLSNVINNFELQNTALEVAGKQDTKRPRDRWAGLARKTELSEAIRLDNADWRYMRHMCVSISPTPLYSMYPLYYCHHYKSEPVFDIILNF